MTARTLFCKSRTQRGNMSRRPQLPTNHAEIIPQNGKNGNQPRGSLGRTGNRPNVIFDSHIIYCLQATGTPSSRGYPPVTIHIHFATRGTVEVMGKHTREP